ncbi:MAG: hypothetical protein Q7R49_02820 [Candidatus Daviesbacteria bacterium]|nr:hypothetical protein [Candidatus Daviesbacteria bacterium]
MPSKFTLVLLAVVGLSLWVTYTLLNSKTGSSSLAIPGFQQMAKSSPIPTPETPTYNPPKDYKFDENTNVQNELDSINPQVVDTDFTDLESLQESF